MARWNQANTVTPSAAATSPVTGLLGAALLAFSQRGNFVRKGQPSLTERLNIRLAPGEKQQLRGIARDGGLSASGLVRLRALGRAVVCRTDATTIRELRRLGGPIKKAHVDSGRPYSAATANAPAALTRNCRAAGDRAIGMEVASHDRQEGSDVERRPAPKSKAHNVRELVDHIAGPKAGGDGEKSSIETPRT
jgi:hypothetical protein